MTFIYNWLAVFVVWMIVSVILLAMNHYGCNWHLVGKPKRRKSSVDKTELFRDQLDPADKPFLQNQQVSPKTKKGQ